MSASDPSHKSCFIQGTSELNNLLQIIGGTADLLENIWAGRDDSGKYLAMLRADVDRAAKVTAEMVAEAGGATTNVLAAIRLDRSNRVQPPPKRRVMVVDDEPMMVKLFERLLTAEGYDVVPAASGCQALDLLTREPDTCDLVVLDFSMPFMSGEETFRGLRAICPELQVILATGFIHQTVLDRMLADGLGGFVRKPVHPDELLEFVARILPPAPAAREASSFRGIAAAA